LQDLTTCMFELDNEPGYISPSPSSALVFFPESYYQIISCVIFSFQNKRRSICLPPHKARCLIQARPELLKPSNSIARKWRTTFELVHKKIVIDEVDDFSPLSWSKSDLKCVLDTLPIAPLRPKDFRVSKVRRYRQTLAASFG
jgi:hypothetical protein